MSTPPPRTRTGDHTKYSSLTRPSTTNTSYLYTGTTHDSNPRALDANGTAGAWRRVVSVTDKQPLSAPPVSGGNDAQGRPTLTWKAVTGAAKYEVYRARSKDGDYIKYSTVTGTSYTNTSYIEDGNQKISEGTYGKSITDACLGWEKSEKLVLELADLL